jgi:hypothetical protein
VCGTTPLCNVDASGAVSVKMHDKLGALMGSPAGFGKLVVDDTDKWGKLIRAANIKAD